MAGKADRAALATEVRISLERHCPGSTAKLIGSLALGTEDAFSDIDIVWVVPDERFSDCLARAVRALREVRPVDSVRGDPDFHHSDRRRLLFVRFTGVPLFWHLDLDVRAASVRDRPHYAIPPSRTWRTRSPSSPPNASAAAMSGARVRYRRRAD